MAKITRITSQQKNKHRFNIFVDQGQGEVYGFSVDEDILVEYHLRKGMELDEPTVQTLIKKDNIQKSFTLAIRYLSYRMRSQKEVRDYLLKKEVDSEHVEVIIERLLREGLLDDQEFATALVRTRVNTTSKGPLLLKKELLDKGITTTIANEALLFYTYDKQYQKAAKWVEKKLGTNRKKSFRQQVQNIQQTLIQKGFSHEVIKDVLSDIEAEKDVDVEWEAVVLQGEKLVRKYEKKETGYQFKQKVKAALYRKGFEAELIDRFIEEQME